MTGSEREEVVVVGGGAVGVSCAYFIARAGRTVRLLERGELCSGSSHGNAGLVPPSRSVPLAVPGVIAKALRWTLNRHGPFRLRPRADADFAAWLWRFHQACRVEATRRATGIALDLIRRSLALYEQLAAAGLEFGFRRNGLLVLFRSEAGGREALADADGIREYGVATESLGVEAVKRLEPRIVPAVAGGVLYPEDAHLDPPQFVRELAEAAKRAGARVDTAVEVRRLRLEGGRIVELETSCGVMSPKVVVLASGAWTGRIAASTGLRLLIEPAKGYGFALENGVGELPLLFHEARTTLTPMADRLWVTGKLDLVGFDISNGGRRADAIPGTVLDYLKLSGPHEVVERWSGFRPLTPDGLPIIGMHPAARNLVIAAGHGRLGLALAPLTGELVSELASGGDPSIDLDPFRPDRFARGRR